MGEPGQDCVGKCVRVSIADDGREDKMSDGYACVLEYEFTCGKHWDLRCASCGAVSLCVTEQKVRLWKRDGDVGVQDVPCSRAGVAYTVVELER